MDFDMEGYCSIWSKLNHINEFGGLDKEFLENELKKVIDSYSGNNLETKNFLNSLKLRNDGINILCFKKELKDNIEVLEGLSKLPNDPKIMDSDERIAKDMIFLSSISYKSPLRGFCERMVVYGNRYDGNLISKPINNLNEKELEVLTGKLYYSNIPYFFGNNEKINSENSFSENPIKEKSNYIFITNNFTYTLDSMIEETKQPYTILNLKDILDKHNIKMNFLRNMSKGNRTIGRIVGCSSFVINGFINGMGFFPAIVASIIPTITGCVVGTGIGATLTYIQENRNKRYREENGFERNGEMGKRLIDIEKEKEKDREIIKVKSKSIEQEDVFSLKKQNEKEFEEKLKDIMKSSDELVVNRIKDTINTENTEKIPKMINLIDDDNISK